MVIAWIVVIYHNSVTNNEVEHAMVHMNIEWDKPADRNSVRTSPVQNY